MAMFLLIVIAAGVIVIARAMSRTGKHNQGYTLKDRKEEVELELAEMQLKELKETERARRFAQLDAAAAQSNRGHGKADWS
jgi:hypothetical protein